jgi:ankyrin repeat protein
MGKEGAMAPALPPQPSLDWLRKTAKDQLRGLRAVRPGATLAQAQLELARQYGFASWRALKAHVDELAGARAGRDDAAVRRFLEHVGTGDAAAVRAAISADPGIVCAVGPHPFWGGRPQALHVAAEAGQQEVFDLLLAGGADVNGRNDQYEHWSPLALAIDRGRTAMQRALLDAGSRVGPLEALLLGDDAAAAVLLPASWPQLSARTPNGGSWLAFARTTAAIDMLLGLGADAHLADRWGTSPVEALSRLGPGGRPLVAHLRSRGIPAAPQEYARLGDQETLAMLASRDPAVIRSAAVLNGAVGFGHHALAEWLLAQGADPNARAERGSRGSALHSAAWEGDLRMARLLVSYGADTGARDAEHHNTPAGWARASARVTGNPRCLEVAVYLDSAPDEDAGRAL